MNVNVSAERLERAELFRLVRDEVGAWFTDSRGCVWDDMAGLEHAVRIWLMIEAERRARASEGCLAVDTMCFGDDDLD